jgi:hypothetical protein
MSVYEGLGDGFECPWWEEESPEKALGPLLQLYKYFVGEDEGRLAAIDAYSRIYLNRDIAESDYLAGYTAAWDIEENAYSRVPVNLSKIMVDSVHARITRQNPRPVFVTKGGNWTLHKKARQMQKWVEYCEHYTNLRAIKKAACLDSIIYGTGFVKTAAHPVVDTVENDRVHPSDIFIDQVEAASNSKPSHVYQRCFVNRTKLAKLFPEYREKIRSAGRISGDNFVWQKARRTIKNMVEVVEAWRLPSYDGADDGAHAIAIDGAVLVLDEWESEVFPFSVMHWKTDPTISFWGVSLIEELLGIHYDFNHTIKKVEECIDNMPTPYILVPEGGNVSVGKLGNVNGIIINYADRKPEFQLPPAVPPDVAAYAQSIWDKGLQVSRLVGMTSPESMGGQFQTGAAVRDFNDIQSTELSTQHESFEAFNVHLYEQQVRAGRAIYDRNPGFKVVARKDRYTIEDVEWEKIDDPRKDSFIIQVFPASMLSQTPSGRKEDVLDYFNAGWLDVGEAMDLLDMPDMDKFRNLRNAPRQNAERILEDILDEGKYEAPEPTLDLRLTLKMTQMFINRGQTLNAPKAHLALLRKFARQVKRLNDLSEESTILRGEGNGLGPTGGPPAVSPDGSMPTAI